MSTGSEGALLLVFAIYARVNTYAPVLTVSSQLPSATQETPAIEEKADLFATEPQRPQLDEARREMERHQVR